MTNATKDKRAGQSLSDVIRAEFFRQGISIRELCRRTRSEREAENTGLRYQTVFRWVKGQGGCTADTLERIADALNFKLSARRK